MTTQKRVKTALEIRELFRDVSCFFEKHTSVVCPSCETVCCVSRHGYYREDDIAFLSALGTDLPSFDRGREPSDPCSFLTDTGCTLERWMRPFHCTWFFCEPLHGSMLEDSRKAYREFIRSFQRLVTLRHRLVDQDSC